MTRHTSALSLPGTAPPAFTRAPLRYPRPARPGIGKERLQSARKLSSRLGRASLPPWSSTPPSAARLDAGRRPARLAVTRGTLRPPGVSGACKGAVFTGLGAGGAGVIGRPAA